MQQRYASGDDVKKTYNIQGDGNGGSKNCVTMAKYLASDYISNLPGGMGRTPFGWTCTPADFGMAIRTHIQELENQQGVKVSIGSQKSGKSTNCLLNK